MIRRHLLLAAAATISCQPAPDPGELFTHTQMSVLDGSSAVHSVLIDACNEAYSTLDVALPTIEDTLVADAIIAAHARGVDVRVVTDFDHASGAGVQALQNADVPLQLADGGLAYFDFNIEDDVLWTSDMTIMSHAWVLVDQTNAVLATYAGDTQTGWRVVLELTGEDLSEDLWAEHNQVFNGADATSTTEFDALAKSITDVRWAYPTDSELILELWFGPQERITKQVIDAVYSARSSIRILTDDFGNDGLAHALQSKAAFGFDVEMVVGPAFGLANPGAADLLLAEAPDVPKWHLPNLDGAEVPTIILIDVDDNAHDQGNNARVMVLSHDLYAAARLFNDAEVVNDQLIDGTLWTLVDHDDPSPPLLDLRNLWDAYRDAGEAIQ